MKSKTAWAPKRGTSVLLAGLALLAAASLCLLPTAAAAATPTAITFRNTRQTVSVRGGPGNSFWTVSEGTSVASGAITGSFGLTDIALVHQHPPTKDGHFGTIHIDSLLTGKHGTIIMDIRGQFVSRKPNGTETVKGHWTIIGATGSYANLHATGSDDTTIDTTNETITDTLTGFAHNAPN